MKWKFKTWSKFSWMFRKHYLFQARWPNFNVQTPLPIVELFFSSIFLVAKMKISECLGAQENILFSNVRFSIKSSSDQEIRFQGEESIWQKRRITKMVSPHKYIRNTSTDGTILKDHMLNSSGRLRISERVRNIPMQPLGWRKDEKRNQKKKSAILVKSWRGGGSPTIRKKEKKPYSGDVCWHGKGFFRDQRGTGWKAYAKQDEIRNVHVVCVAVLCCPSPSFVSPAVEGGWMLEGGVWSMDLGRGQPLAAERQPEGKGGRSSATRKVCGKSPGHHRRKTSSLSGMQRVGTTSVTPFPTNQLRLRQAPGRALIRLARPSSSGLICLHKLWGPDWHPSQSLLDNQPWDRNPPVLAGAER